LAATVANSNRFARKFWTITNLYRGEEGIKVNVQDAPWRRVAQQTRTRRNGAFVRRR